MQHTALVPSYITAFFAGKAIMPPLSAKLRSKTTVLSWYMSFVTYSSYPYYCRHKTYIDLLCQRCQREFIVSECAAINCERRTHNWQASWLSDNILAYSSRGPRFDSWLFCGTYLKYTIIPGLCVSVFLCPLSTVCPMLYLEEHPVLS